MLVGDVRRASREAVAVFLIVVGRQPRIVGRHERLEVPPGLARGPPQKRAVRVADSGRTRAPTGTLSQ